MTDLPLSCPQPEPDPDPAVHQHAHPEQQLQLGRRPLPLPARPLPPAWRGRPRGALRGLCRVLPPLERGPRRAECGDSAVAQPRSAARAGAWGRGPAPGRMGLFLPFACAVGADRGPVLSLRRSRTHSLQCCGECPPSVPAQTGPLATAPARGCLSQDRCVSPNAGHECGSHKPTKWGLACRRPAAAAFLRLPPPVPACPGGACGHCWRLLPPATQLSGGSRLSSPASRVELRLASAPLRPILVPGPTCVQVDWDDCRGAVMGEGPGRNWSNRSSGPGAPSEPGGGEVRTCPA